MLVVELAGEGVHNVATVGVDLDRHISYSPTPHHFRDHLIAVLVDCEQLL